MGFGLYGDRGTLDCARHPGAKGHEAQDGAWFGAHKIDWYKEDACYASGDQATALAEYGLMRDALNKSGCKLAVYHARSIGSDQPFHWAERERCICCLPRRAVFVSA